MRQNMQMAAVHVVLPAAVHVVLPAAVHVVLVVVGAVVVDDEDQLFDVKTSRRDRRRDLRHHTKHVHTCTLW